MLRVLWHTFWVIITGGLYGLYLIVKHLTKK